MKVRKAAKIRYQYNQVPHLTQNSTRESDKNTNTTKKEQEVSPFPAGDYKAAMNRHKSMTNTDINKINDPQKKYRLASVSIRKYLLEGLNQFYGTNLAGPGHIWESDETPQTRQPRGQPCPRR